MRGFRNRQMRHQSDKIDQKGKKKKKKNSNLTNFGIQHQTSSIGSLFLPLAFPHSTFVFSFGLKRSGKETVKGWKRMQTRNRVTVFSFTISCWAFLKEGLSGTMKFFSWKA